jgi:pimeloyl-ACP methyl ester carboxylesterase
MKIKVNEVELYYEVHGEGEPIIFVHGWMDDCSVWKSQIELFAKKYNVIAYDHRGHGRSDKPKGDYSIQTLSNDLHSLIQKLNFEKVTLIGHSMGGMTALIFTLDHPDKVSKLVLVGTTAKMTFSFRIYLWVMIHIFSYESFARGKIEFNYHEPSEQVIKEALDIAMKTPKYAAYECFTEFTKNYDIRDRVSKIKVPTLIVVGEKDKATPVEMSQYLNRQIEGSKLRFIPDSKHMVMIDKSEELDEIMEEFIV